MSLKGNEMSNPNEHFLVTTVSPNLLDMGSIIPVPEFYRGGFLVVLCRDFEKNEIRTSFFKTLEEAEAFRRGEHKNIYDMQKSLE